MFFEFENQKVLQNMPQNAAHRQIEDEVKCRGPDIGRDKFDTVYG